MPLCEFKGCGREVRGRGKHCSGHEQQQRRGHPLTPLRRAHAQIGDEPLSQVSVRVTRACLDALGDQPGTRAREVLERWARRR